MLSYLSYTVVAALLMTCHALGKCPGAPGRDGLKGQPRLPRLRDFLDTGFHNSLVNLKYRLSRLEGVLALDGKIKVVGEKILASNGKEVDFESALESCEEAGGTLATPVNEEENKAILGIVKQYNRYAYLGIKEGETSGEFMDINGTPLNYTKWHQNEPNGKGRENCVEMYSDGTWNDKKCNLNRLTICEF